MPRTEMPPPGLTRSDVFASRLAASVCDGLGYIARGRWAHGQGRARPLRDSRLIMPNHLIDNQLQVDDVADLVSVHIGALAWIQA